jgi:hypothetical protein
LLVTMVSPGGTACASARVGQCASLGGVLPRLPGWVVDNAESIRGEVAPFVSASDAERIDATRRCCRGAMRMLRFHPHPPTILDWVDPLPATSVVALARLRAQFRR